ncbi:hypothetical protein C7R57_04595 [Macrococcoides caseolyticum subsp. caseolyticum]|uniref:DUF6339 family protein n=1 Tax=Macrococcoides caseolyticum TaxID=69966 RepID=UPI000CD1E793|nr:DUF6339 family protein [Macrococcus caseolyticus]PNZ75034.1 hypothetical protein CD152_00820 [Macrococcus caseolyticus]QPT45898.1 hypothetical protein I6G25_06620 [Macrococcus caseolyticus]QQB05226.1 hypothetical protein I6H62_09645 [Macrococcus caseolyticus]RAK47360.1 hypothetical protein C7R57_04595 [Macrococcus caseolyticus subsp. caseolyticus]TDM29438.1 hypothetical protein ETH98_05235 [Macrococcus caseolyticus]
MNLKAKFEDFSKGFITRYNAKVREYIKEANILEDNMIFDYQSLLIEEDYKEAVRKNFEIMYEILKRITPVQTSQEKFWVATAFSYYLDCIQYRLKKDLDKANKKCVKSASVYVNEVQHLLFVNMLSRLWWVGYLTYEETPETPYTLTKFFCENDFIARAVVFFLSNFTTNKELELVILSTLYKLKQQGVGSKRLHFVEAN